MNRHNLVASVGLVAGLAFAVSAQAPSSNGQVDEKAIQSIRIKVIGCVSDGREAGQYRLTNAVLSGDDMPSIAGTAGKVGSDRTSPSRTVRRSISLVTVSRPMWATRSK